MMNLLEEAKERDAWLLHWGNTAFTVLMPLNKEEEKMDPGELDNYIRMVQAHGNVRLSYGAAMITGLYEAEKISRCFEIQRKTLDFDFWDSNPELFSGFRFVRRNH